MDVHLIEPINERISAGVSKDEIKGEVLSHGYSEQEFEDAFAQASIHTVAHGDTAPKVENAQNLYDKSNSTKHTLWGLPLYYFFIIGLFCICLTTYYFYSKNHWEVYNDPLGMFEVEFPVNPVHTQTDSKPCENSTPCQDLDYIIHSYTVEVEDKIMYQVNAVDYGVDVITNSVNGLEVALGALDNPEFKNLSSYMTTFDGNQSIKYKADLGNSNMAVEGYMIANGSEFYQITVVYHDKKTKLDDRKKFFDSFKIKNKQ